MADIVRSAGQGIPSTIRFRYRDMGDGTHAQLMATAASGIVPEGADLTLTHTVVNVNGDTAVIAANPNRRYLLLVNDSDTVVYLRLQAGAAAVNSGVRLNASGGSYELTPASGIYTGAIRANHGGGAVNKALLVTEG